jgi:hypothetical protein
LGAEVRGGFSARGGREGGEGGFEGDVGHGGDFSVGMLLEIWGPD